MTFQEDLANKQNAQVRCSSEMKPSTNPPDDMDALMAGNEDHSVAINRNPSDNKKLGGSPGLKNPYINEDEE